MSATYVCPNGHQSATDDYCDLCGAKIGRAAPDPTAQVPVVPAAPSGEAPAVAAAGELCPACGAARVGSDRFCEGCGYDFVTQATSAQAAAAVSAATADGEARWDAVISADRAYFDEVASPGVEFPPHCPDRTFPLAGAQLRIGRRSASRGIYPEIDLSGAPEDSAVSHLHALLVRGVDGSYSLVDPGSTNGTTVNDSPDPIAVNTPIPLAEGDRIHVGAWTTITIHARPKPGG
jgi:hypothetical protein